MVKSKSWKLLFSKRALNDAKKLKKSHLAENVKLLLAILEENPLQNPAPFKKLVGDFSGYYSRRINIQHRLVYSIDVATNAVRIISMCHHYDE